MPRPPAFAVPFAVLLTCACAAEDFTLDHVFDPCATRVLAVEASPDELASIDAALAEWNALAGLRLQRATSADEEGALPIAFAPSIPAFFGLYDDEEGSIVINRNIDDDRSRTLVIMHELGHAFGLLHVSPETELSLMNPGNTQVPPTNRDVERVFALWDRCSPSADGDR